MSGALNPMMVQPGQSVGQTSANTYNTAVNATNAAMRFNPGSIANANMSQYMNPYTQNVIDNNLDAMNRANQMALNNVGADANRNGAFGGGRMAAVEAMTNADFLTQARDMTNSANAANFMNAQNMAQQDISNQFNRQNAVLGAANQLAGLSQQGFNYDQKLNSNLANVGSQQEGLLGLLLSAAQGEYGNIVNYGNTMLQLPLMALGAAPGTTAQIGSGTTTETKTPGLFDYLTLGATTLSKLAKPV
jgi:hypothetical protein